MKFKNVKVGDTVFVRHILSYSLGWSRGKFEKCFYLGYKVTKVTKTQFTAQFKEFEFRFKKSGSGFNCDKVAFVAGDVDRWGGVVTGNCEYGDYLSHESDLKTIRSADLLDIKITDCKSIEKALEVAALLEHAAKLIKEQQRE